MSRRWDENDTAKLRQLHAEGRSMHAIADELGWSKTTISRRAVKLGIDWDRGQTAAAAEAVHVDNRALRVEIERRMLEQSVLELDALGEAARVYAFGGADNKYSEEWLERPPPQDRKAIAHTLSTMTTAANRLHELNAAREAEAAKSTLARLREALTEQVRGDAAD